MARFFVFATLAPMARKKSSKPTKKRASGRFVYMYGRHALAEALAQKPDAIQKVFLKNDFDDPHIRGLLQRNNILVQPLGAHATRAVHDAVHQGVIAVLDTTRVLIESDVFLSTLVPSQSTALLLLDELTDPHNVGAVIRSAAAFGFAGVLLPSHNQVQLTGAVIKTSAGMAFQIPLVSVGNINNVLRTLKEKGFWIYGLSMNGESLPGITFDAPSVFVLGNEGRGIREKTLDVCDLIVSIPMNPGCESLNAAQAATVAMYSWWVQHRVL